MKRLAKQRICITQSHRQQCVDGGGTGQSGSWEEGGKEGKMGISVIVSAIKNFKELNFLKFSKVVNVFSFYPDFQKGLI